MEKTQEEILKETGGIMTSESARGSPIHEEDDGTYDRMKDEQAEEEFDKLSDSDKKELIAGGNKYSLNGDI